MNEEVNGVDAEEEMLDIPPAFHSVVKQYGREMFALVMNAGMGGEAAKVLSAFVQKHQSHHSAHALGVLASSFNQISNAYVKQMGWSEELVAQCDRDCQLAHKNQIIMPGSSILLNS